MKLFVFHTPELVPEGSTPACAVVIDVLRATTTMVTALAAGAEAVQVFSDLDLLVETSEAWPPERRLRIGERGGKTVEGFDLGNSPLDCTPERVQGRRIFISSTNGTRAFQRVQAVPIVIAAALINLQSVVQFLQAEQPETVWIVGSGWEGGYSLEDTVCAGAILHHLGSDLQIGNDEAIAAIALYRQWQDDLLGLLHSASHGQRLLRLGCDADIAYCTGLSTVAALPRQKELGVLKA
ncbi:2-phosphosulfolactate phosphatase family protein [Leptolyngbya sp. FACHB-261]|uniref:2-phosphosulfolactate phosphatase family protein n=1 Tax=Leptolyngbya sp. FACHB-261 TaxID=2692806 RepID=UPI001687B0D9|nr:2-phosphosulfolactate phosphatase family protein [Leptolyngbya sp. FACHB-261]MBD2099381.1 2-phosphosulfolactate phosphatase family protein [Leptolyngbya sp. FACHB-261]